VRQVTFGPTSPLSHLFEYGTGPRVQYSTGRYTGVMSPRPFIEPVVEAGLEEMVEAMADVLGLRGTADDAGAAQNAHFPDNGLFQDLSLEVQHS
jgi:hypothetical protein